MRYPLQIYLDEADLQRLDRWANDRGWTKTQAIRVAVRILTKADDEDPILSASGMIDELPEDLSEKFDRYLQETYVAEKGAHYGKKRKSNLRG
jgi:hypothetical protein